MGEVTLPNWPRLLKPKLAAAYVGCGLSKLEQYVAEDPMFPKPVVDPLNSTRRWDRLALDRWVDLRFACEQVARERTSALVDRVMGESGC